MIVLLHVSDLHTGEKLSWRGSFQPPGQQRTPTKWPSKRGHDEGVAVQLTNEWERIVKKWPDAQRTICVSGDLTRTGDGDQFGLAHRFIHAFWLVNPANPSWLGLGSGGRSALTIPGNHDFWNSVVMNPVVGRGVLEPHFWPLPWFHPLEDVANHLEVHIIGLDSCSGLWNVSPSQVISVGAIDPAQLARAQDLLNAAHRVAENRGRRVLRTVMVHHPPDRLTKSSRHEFSDWVQGNHIHVVMTGHTHVPLPRLHGTWPPPLTSPSSPLPPNQIGAASGTELRCGTTLQTGTATHLPGPWPNHFFVHGIEVCSSGLPNVDWRSLAYEHTGLSWVSTGTPIWSHTFTAL